MTVTGQCYCGATRFELDSAPESVTNCNCTYCSRTGALWAYYGPDQVKFSSRDGESVFAPRMNRHHFCSVCGIPTFGESPTWDLATHQPDFTRMRLGINARLLEGFDLEAVEHKAIDGRHLW